MGQLAVQAGEAELRQAGASGFSACPMHVCARHAVLACPDQLVLLIESDSGQLRKHEHVYASHHQWPDPDLLTPLG